jgi:hypothetical protein
LLTCSMEQVESGQTRAIVVLVGDARDSALQPLA